MPSRAEIPTVSALLEGAPIVLVIDDDPTVHGLMPHFLSKEGLRAKEMNHEKGSVDYVQRMSIHC